MQRIGGAARAEARLGPQSGVGGDPAVGIWQQDGTMNRLDIQTRITVWRAAVLLELVGGGDAWTRAVRLLVISTPLCHIPR
jgi:hypothetical protein